MVWLRYKYILKSNFSSPVTRHAFKVRVSPMPSARQRIINSEIVVLPNCLFSESVDGFGNRVHYTMIDLPHDTFMIESSGLVDIVDAVDCSNPLDDIYTVPTHLTEYDESIASLAVKDNVVEIMHRVHNILEYKQGVTTNSTTAIEVINNRCGVCQDFSHLMIAVCRSCGMKARYVNGLMVGEGATHAWVEVVVNGKWCGFDPTHDRLVTSQYLKFAHGRDVNDCPTNRGLFCGWTDETMFIEGIVEIEDNNSINV